MDTTTYVYENRVVAFLDVLGFSEKLKQFEQEASDALTFARNEEYDNLDTGQELVSTKADAFINTFLEAVSKVDAEKFKCYLFSDNICITLNYDSDKSLVIDLLMLVSDLFYSFARKGYFLRGGIDYGKFISQDRIALGIPLVNAYKLETEVAIYPRIVISENFKRIFEEYSSNGLQQIELPIFIESLILQSCENNYLNVFLKVFQTDNKEEYFQNIRNSIIENIVENSLKERVFVKYSWLATEFNRFIDDYVIRLAFLDRDYEPTSEYLNNIVGLKIDQNAN